MKKLLTIFTMMMLLVAIAPMVLAEDNTSVDDNATAEAVACCMAITAECLACADGITADEYCDLHSEDVVCIANDDVSNETEAETEIMVTPYGAEMRLEQLKLSIERNIEKGNALLEDSSFDEETTQLLEDIIVSLENLVISIDELDLEQDPAILADEFVDLKNQAIGLSKDFRDEARSNVKSDKIEELRAKMEAKVQNKMDELKAKFDEQKNQYEFKKTSQVAMRVGLELTGDESVEDMKSMIEDLIGTLSEEQQEQLQTKFKEFNAKEKVAAQAIREQAKEQIEEHREEMNERMEETREEMKKRYENNREEMKQRFEEHRENLTEMMNNHRDDMDERMDEMQEQVLERIEELNISEDQKEKLRERIENQDFIRPQLNMGQGMGFDDVEDMDDMMGDILDDMDYDSDDDNSDDNGNN